MLHVVYAYFDRLEFSQSFFRKIIKNEADILIIEVIDLRKSNFVVVTSPTVAGFKIKKVLGVVTGLASRTRWARGQFKAAFQSLKGGEVKAFTSEIEKARVQAMERAIEKAKEIGANAIILAIFLGALSAIGIGLTISSIAKNEEAANSIDVLISVPLQFSSELSSP